MSDDPSTLVEDSGAGEQPNDTNKPDDASIDGDDVDAGGEIRGSEGKQNETSDTGNGVETDTGNRYDPFSCDDETCTDQTTGLQWKRCYEGLSGNDCSNGTAEHKVWQTAVNDCMNLSFAGNDDWRLPSIYELISIVDFSNTDPSIDTNCFPNTPNFAAWSSTDVLQPEEIGWLAAWGINFRSGWIGYDQQTPESDPFRQVAYYARCVRGPKIKARTFTKRDTVVFDDASSLIWQACSAGQIGTNCSGTALRYSWQDAKTYCNALQDDGTYSDWRLPSIRDLLSLVDYTKANPVVDRIAFPETQSDAYWSSSPIKGYPDHVWYVDFNLGHTRFDRGTETIPSNTATADVAQRYFVRCVRGEL